MDRNVTTSISRAGLPGNLNTGTREWERPDGGRLKIEWASEEGAIASFSKEVCHKGRNNR